MNRLSLLLQLHEEKPGDTFTLFALAKEYKKAQDKEKALEWYLRLQSTDPAYVGLYYHLGKLYETLGQTQQAIDTYRSGMQVAKAAKDMHALAELNGARLQIDDDDEFAV